MAASQPGGLPRQGHVPNGVGSSFRRPEGADARPSPGVAGDADVDAANILEAWDRARAAEDASVHRGGVLHEEAAPSGPAHGSGADEDGLGQLRKHGPGPEDLTRGLLTPGRHAHASNQAARLRLTSIDGRKGFAAVDPSSSEASPSDRVRHAKQRRNSYSVPQTPGLPLDLLVGPGPSGSVSQQGAPGLHGLDSPRGSRRPPTRRATLQDLANAQADPTALAHPVPSMSGQGMQQQGGGTPPWASPGVLSPSSNVPGSPPPGLANGRDQPAGPSGQQHGAAGTAGVPAEGASSEGAGIRRKFIKMMSLQRTKQRTSAQPAAKSPGQDGAHHESEDEEDPVAAAAAAAAAANAASAAAAASVAPGAAAAAAASAAAAANASGAAGRPVAHDSDEEDVDVRASGPAAGASWGMGGGTAGPSPSELRMMGAATSVSFKKSTMKQGVLRPLSTLPPFVPRLFIEDITLNHEKYRGFDAAGRDLTAASKTLQPSIIELQASVMIADVTGFTKLTEILSKKGTSGVELLTTCMNNYFTRAINMIMAYEGDVVKFAGDSMICLFYPNEHERRHPDKGLRACTLRMMACSHQLATKLGHMRMKMNGQVEPAPPPTPDPTPPLPAQPSNLLSAPLMSAPPGLGAAPSGEVEPVDSAAGTDVLRNNSGPISGAAAAMGRRLGRDSPRSSATNQPLGVPGAGMGEEGSPSGTDTTGRGGEDAAAAARKRGKSWSLMANLLKGTRGMGRKSEATMTPASMSPAGSSGPSRVSFDKGEKPGASRMSARERAKTETGLGLALRGSAGGGGSGGGTDTSAQGGAASIAAPPQPPAGLWAGGEGVVRRELSVATKLNLPPPLRPMQGRASQTLSPLNVATSGAAGPTSAPLAQGVYPGSGGALASMASGAGAAAAGASGTPGGSPRSFTEQTAGSGGSFRKAPLGARSERRMAGNPPMVASANAPTGDWRSKLQNLSTAIVQAPGRPEDDPLAPQRSRLSENARAVRWDTVQEEVAAEFAEQGEELAEEGEEGEVEEEHEEDASYPPIQAEAAPSMSVVGQPMNPLASFGRSSGPHTGSTDASGTLSAGERSYSPVGSQSTGALGGTRGAGHVVDLRRKLLLRASQSDKEDANGRRSLGGMGTPASAGAAVGQPEIVLGAGPGPVAEGAEEFRSRHHSEIEHRDGAGGGGFMHKVVSWFSANARNRNSYVDSFSNVAAGHQASGHGGPEGHSEAQGGGSQPPSAPGSASNSFNYTTGLASGIARVPPPNMGVGSGPLGKGPRGDPIMEEVSNSRLSLKVMTSAGSVCVFHVGGGVDEVTDPTLPEVPRWEFFIGDRPLAPLLDVNQRRRCVSQVAAIEDQATAGSVVASIEVVELIQGEWEVVPLPDSVWRVVGPVAPGAAANVRLSHTSVRSSHTSHMRTTDQAGGALGGAGAGGGGGHSAAATPATAEAGASEAGGPEGGAIDDLSALHGMRQPSSGTGQNGPASTLLGPHNRSLGTSLNGSSDRPTNGSGGAQGPPPPPSHLSQPPQSLLAMRNSHSDRLAVGDGGSAAGGANANGGDNMERTNSGPAGPTASGTSQRASHSHGQLVTQTSGSHTAPGAPPPGAGAIVPVAAATPNANAAGLAAALAALPPRLRHEFVNQPEPVQRRIAGLLRMHVLGSVRVRVEAGHLDFINEIRPLTCMFLGFPSLMQPLDDVSHKDQVSCVQFAYTSVQAVMRKWDGSFLQFRSDEKGFVGICAFGLPGHTHEDNPTRGIRAALELASVIKAGGHRCSIGVTTGDLLCTCVGARKLRSEYTVFGDAINLSARLMVKCKKDPSMGDILCDEPTYLRAKYQASFIELEPLPVKGKAQPVLVYRVGAHDATAEAQAAQQRREAAEVSSGERPLIGRDAEMTLTLNHAASMISGMSHGGIIIIEGNTGMGKTKLLMEVRKSLERINADTSISSRPAFHMVFGMADTANKSQKLHPWRRVFQELFSLDLKLKNLGSGNSPPGSATNVLGGGSSQQKRLGAGTSTSGQQQQQQQQQQRRRGTEDGPGHAVFTPLGERLSKVPNYDTEWRQHLAELLDLPLPSIPLGSLEAEQAQYVAALAAPAPPGMAGAGGPGAGTAQPTLSLPGHAPLLLGHESTDGETAEHPLVNGGTSSGAVPGAAVVPASGASSDPAALGPAAATAAAALATTTHAGSMLRAPGPWKSPSVRHASMTVAGAPPALLDAHAHSSTINIAAAAAAAAAANAEVPPPAPHAGAVAPPGGTHGGATHSSQVGAPIRKNSLNFLVHVMQEFISLYGPTLVLLENLHDFDTWSWQLLVKAAEVLTTDCMILATTRPNDLPAVGSSHHLHGKAALYQKVAMMYRHLLKLPSATRIVLEPFNFHQTKSLMQVVADINYPDQYVLAVMEKTGGMPLYIEKVTEFLCQSQRPWLPEQGGEFSANVNKMIRNLNFQQVIIERMDRLKPGIHLTLKVASVMGQWVDLDILHKFYPINKSKEELRAHLQELERGNFLKPTDAEGVWEFNMVERDIVYEVIPHYQRRRLHAKLAQELEKSLEEQHVATLTTIAYHWNQACMGHEVTEVECSLKAIEFWHRAAEAAYSGSSLMEALKLYQKAAQIAEILAESMGGSVTNGSINVMHKGRDRHGDGGRDVDGGTGTSTDGRIDGTDQSFTAVGSAFKGALNWALISRLSRSQWEKSMASCCLGIVLQHRYEFNTQLEYWDTEDYFRLLTEHAIRGLMLLGAPHPKELLSETAGRNTALLSRVFGCCLPGGSGRDSPERSGGGGPQGGGWASGLVLADSEVQEIRDILLVLIIAAEHYSLQHDGGEYTRLLTFCKRVCKFFNKCSDSGTDPFHDIRDACSSRIKNYKASRALQSTLDFGISQEPALEAAAARNAAGGPMVGPELSRAVLGLQRPGTPGRSYG